MDVNFTELAKQVYRQNKDLGHWDIDRPPAMIRLLILSEVFECFEAWRKDNYAQGDQDLEWYLNTASDSDFCPWFRATIKHTVQEECADIIIRLLDYIGHADINPHHTWSRPSTHGKVLDFFETLIDLIERISTIGEFRDVAYQALEYTLFLSGYLCGEDIIPYVHLKLRYSRIMGRDPQKKF